MSFFQPPHAYRHAAVDVLNTGLYNVTQAKNGALRIEPCVIHSYNEKQHTARVWLQSAGKPRDPERDCITVKVQTDFQGALSGTGRAAAPEVGQVWDVAFMGGSAFGLYNAGVLLGVRFLNDVAKAPASPSFHQNPHGTIEVHPGPNGKFGFSRHVDHKSNVSEVRTGKSNLEDWGNHHEVNTGTNLLRSEEVTREASSALKGVADSLG